MVHINKLF